MALRTVVFLSLFVTSVSFAQENNGIVFTEKPFEEILAQAKAEDKIIFMDAYTTWCGPCKWLAANVFTDPEVGAYFNDNFINTKFDMEKGEGIELARRYNVRAYPTLLFINGDGELVHRICGASPAPDFLERSKVVENETKNIGYYLKEYDNGNRSLDFLANYYLSLQDACMEAEGIDDYWDMLSDEQYLSESNWSLMEGFVRDVESDQFQYVLDHYDAFANAHGAENVDRFIYRRYEQMMLQTAYYGSDEEFTSAAERLRSSGYKNAESLILKASVSRTMSEGDFKSMTSFMDQFVSDASLITDADFINSISWTLYENVDDIETLKKALPWMETVVSEITNYSFYDTYAALLFKVGDKENGEKWAKKAIEVAKLNGDDPSGTEELLENYTDSSL